MKSKFNIKGLKKVVKEATTEEMTRMEAWEAVVAAGVDIPWESFKRLWTVCK